MFRTATTSVRMLQAFSLVVSLAVLLWSLGLPTLQFTEAANITTVSNTLSDSDLAAVSNHTITFSSPTGIANGDTITVTFPLGFNLSTSSVDFSDIDIASTTDYSVAADCTGAEEIGAAIASQVLTLTFCSGDGAFLDAAGTTTIEIGTNATAGATGDQRVTNHGTAGSYEFDITAGASDAGSTRVVVLDNVVVTAAVDTIFSFTVSGFAVTGVDVNGTTTTATSSATEIPFGTLSADTIATVGQRLNVSTNAANGFVVTVQQSQDLLSATGADINGFIDGAYTDTPAAWQAPASTLGSTDTYGHWGLTSADDLNTSEFGSNLWVAASTTPRQVFENSGVADGTTANVGSTTVGYQVEIGSLQEAADDYSTTLTYVATPTF